MTVDILLAVNEHIKKNSITQAKLAELTGLQQGHISQMLNGKRGSIESWLTLLNALDLELKVTEKPSPPKKRK